MNTSRAWFVYAIVRLLAFLVPFGIVMLVLPTWQWNWVLALVVGSVVGLAVSEIFLGRQRAQIGSEINERREAKLQTDQRRPVDVEEDAIIEADQTPPEPEEDTSPAPAEDRGLAESRDVEEAPDNPAAAAEEEPHSGSSDEPKPDADR